MSELRSALDSLSADDLHAMGAGDLLDRTAELVRARNRIDAELARTVRVADLAQVPEHDGLIGQVGTSPSQGRICSSGQCCAQRAALPS